jgi:hypothetical protein
MYFTVAIRTMDGERQVTWRDGTLSGDSVLIERFAREAANTSVISHAGGASYPPPWIDNPYAALHILSQLGTVVRANGDVPPESPVPGR